MQLVAHFMPYCSNIYCNLLEMQLYAVVCIKHCRCCNLLQQQIADIAPYSSNIFCNTVNSECLQQYTATYCRCCNYSNTLCLIVAAICNIIDIATCCSATMQMLQLITATYCAPFKQHILRYCRHSDLLQWYASTYCRCCNLLQWHIAPYCSNTYWNI